MGEETRADLRTLQSIADRLRRAGDSLDAAGRGAPPAPDAGDVTPEVTALIGHLAGGAGNLVVGLKEAGDRVDLAQAGYRGSDSSATDRLGQIF